MTFRGWCRSQRNRRCLRAANRTNFQLGLCPAAAGGDPAAGAGCGRLAVLLCDCPGVLFCGAPPVVLLPDKDLHDSPKLLRDTARPVCRRHTKSNLLSAPGPGLRMYAGSGFFARFIAAATGTQAFTLWSHRSGRTVKRHLGRVPARDRHPDRAASE